MFFWGVSSVNDECSQLELLLISFASLFAAVFPNLLFVTEDNLLIFLLNEPSWSFKSYLGNGEFHDMKAATQCHPYPNKWYNSVSHILLHWVFLQRSISLQITRVSLEIQAKTLKCHNILLIRGYVLISLVLVSSLLSIFPVHVSLLLPNSVHHWFITYAFSLSICLVLWNIS